MQLIREILTLFFLKWQWKLCDTFGQVDISPLKFVFSLPLHPVQGLKALHRMERQWNRLPYSVLARNIQKLKQSFALDDFVSGNFAYFQ